MPFSRPTLEQLIARARADVEFRLQGADAHLRALFEDVIAVVTAGQAHGLHGHLVFLSEQIVPDTAKDEFAVRWASIFNVNQIAAQPAKGSMLVTGINGTAMLAGRQWRRSDGWVFATDADATIVSGSALVAITAVDLGAKGNSSAATSLSIVSPLSGITSIAAVQAPGLQNGSDLESTAALLERLLQRIRLPPKGGGPGDYVRWAREVAGVTRAFEFAAYTGVGTVGVTFLTDGELSPIPNGAKVTEVQNYINGKAPITAKATVFAPTGVTQNFVLSLTPNTPTVQAAVKAEVNDLWLRKAKPGGTILLSQINEAISLAKGEEDHVLTTPAANVVRAAGEISLPGTFTFS